MKRILREQADFDQREPELHDFDRQEFSDRGKADLKVRRNDPRFADNPMEMLDEFSGGKLDQLQQMLNKIGVSDQQIRGGVPLQQTAKSRLAARLGIGPKEVDIYINTLAQKLKKEQGEQEDNELLDSLREQYYREVVREAGQPRRPFVAEDRYSYEPDALGSVTVRDATSGKEKFIQGAAASNLLGQLQANGSNKDAILAPLVERASSGLDDGPDKPFSDEINADSGAYNFLWKLHGQHGMGTVMFHAKQSPMLKLVDVRDADGDEIDVEPRMRRELLRQAQDFLGNE